MLSTTDDLCDIVDWRAQMLCTLVSRQVSENCDWMVEGGRVGMGGRRHLAEKRMCRGGSFKYVLVDFNIPWRISAPPTARLLLHGSHFDCQMEMADMDSFRGVPSHAQREQETNSLRRRFFLRSLSAYIFILRLCVNVSLLCFPLAKWVSSVLNIAQAVKLCVCHTAITCCDVIWFIRASWVRLLIHRDLTWRHTEEEEEEEVSMLAVLQDLLAIRTTEIRPITYCARLDVAGGKYMYMYMR